MADTVVNLLLTNLTQLLKDEAKLLSGVEEKVMLLQQDLEWMKDFLIKSEANRDAHETVKLVVRQIRDMAYDVQDAIDNYVVDVVHHRRKGVLKKLLNSVDHVEMLHSVNNQIDMIKTKISNIYDNKDRYGINEGESAATAMEALAIAETVQRRRRDVEEDEVVGFNEYANEVTKLLVEGNTSCEIVSIIGMVGCGKTTLARKVYRDPQINKLFDCCAWEFVTKEFNIKELLLSLLQSFKAIPEDKLKHIQKEKNKKGSDSTDKITQEIAIFKNMLREYLSDKRYLIVLDDIWSSQVLEEIRDAFSYDNMGSRILITTRSEDVALKICTIEPYKLKPLKKEDRCTLFYTKVFKGEKYPPYLEVVVQKAAAACKGLPLSIVVLAGILRSKEKSVLVWERVMENVDWYISQEDAVVKDIVRLSYESLPRRLKPCFLYFGIYPEDYDIPVKQLIHLWIAEGFIAEIGSGNMIEEDVAEEYLEELIRRNLIQLESRRTDGGVKTCRIHDLLRELCISESIKENFLVVRTDNNFTQIGKPRRLSLHGSPTYYKSGNLCDHSRTRSLFSFTKDEYNGYSTGFKEWIPKNFKLIQVLDVGKMKGSSGVFGELEDLIHLRYLGTRDSDTFNFPKSIYELWNLETLDLRNANVSGLPDGIWKLKRLRHLYMAGSDTKLPNIPGKKILPNVQTLSRVCLNHNTVQQLEKNKFPGLRKLGVDCLSSYDIQNPIEYLRKLGCLGRLNRLKIFFGKNTLTSVEGFPPNITKVTLVKCFYLSKLVSALGSLPKLRYLKISGKDSGDFTKLELECTKSGCFPQLLVLKMKGLNCVSWNLGKGGMHQLRHLVINRCEFSTNLPSVESFTSLEEVEVLWSSKTVVDKLKHMGLKDSCKLTVCYTEGYCTWYLT